MFLVRNTQVGDHLHGLLLQLRGPLPAPSLQLGIEPEVFPHSQPILQNVLILRICFFCSDWVIGKKELLLIDGVEGDCDWNHYRFLFSQLVNDLTQ